ncbi:MAG: HAMP domain-containing sensor histidine kinase, partial [Bdellovibrionota bacterium]
MTKNKKFFSWSFESVTLVVLSIAFVGVMFGAWTYAMKLRETVAANAAGMNLDPAPLLEVEKLRNLAEAQMSDARSFFLLGSKALLDKQTNEKQAFADSLANFSKQHSLPELPEITARIEALVKQQQDIFDQAMDFREKQTESKIVGQFYQSKTAPIRSQMNENLDEIIRLHNAKIDNDRVAAKAAGHDAEAQIPAGMKQLIQIVGGLFLAMALLVIVMLRKRSFQLAERDRLVEEAKSALLARDEVISAVSRDLKEPLNTITETAESMTTAPSAGDVTDRAELIKSSIHEIEGFIEDIRDQKKADLKILGLRVDQLGIDELLEEAELMMKPQAKQSDVRLQFEAVNPPVSAFADKERVLRILSNLIGNAIKFSAKHSRVVIKVKSD